MSDNNIKKLLTALISPTQGVEDALQQLLLERGVDGAVGAQLTILGKLVGQPRNGMSDDDYRRIIRARITANRSKGTIADQLKITDLVVDDPAVTLTMDNQGMACFVVRLEDAAVPDSIAAILIDLLCDATAGGVRPIVEWSPEAPSLWLQMDTDNLDEEHFIAAIDCTSIIVPVVLDGGQGMQGYMGLAFNSGITGNRWKLLSFGSPGGFRD